MVDMKKYALDKFRNSKKSHVTCPNQSQYIETKTEASFGLVMTHTSISNTDVSF